MKYIAQAKEVATAMATAWINFVTSLDPNGKNGLPGGTVWPAYNASGDAGQDLIWDLGKCHVESDDWRKEGIAWWIGHALSVLGN